MPINTEVAVAWFEQRRGTVSYSMTHRDGPSSYDCSSSVYYALRAAGASAASWAVNTESAHNWLIANGYALIAENRDWNMQRVLELCCFEWFQNQRYPPYRCQGVLEMCCFEWFQNPVTRLVSNSMVLELCCFEWFQNTPIQELATSLVLELCCFEWFQN